MKKFFLSATSFACMLCSVAGEWSFGAPWYKEADNVFRVEYTGTGWSGMRRELKLQPDTFYRISGEIQGASNDEPALGISVELTEKRQASGEFYSGKAWTPCVLYFYNREGTSAICRVYAKGKQPLTLRMRNFQVEKLTAEDLTGDLLPDGDFEQSERIPSFWRNAWRAKEYRGAIVPNAGFPAGTRNLEISFVPASEDASGLRSHLIPIQPGCKYEWRFWARTETAEEYTIACLIQVWPQFGPHTGTHIYKLSKLKVTPEWNEYAILLAVPENDGSVPDLGDCTANLQIGGDPESACKVRFDDMSFRKK